MRPGLPRREMPGAAAELRRPAPGTHGSRHRRVAGSSTVSSPITDPKDLVVAADRLRHLHGDLCPARRVLHTPMLDLKGLHRLGEFRRPTGDLHPITETEIPVGEPNHSDTHP